MIPRVTYLCAATLGVVGGTQLPAQVRASAADSARGCPYEACALRVEPRAFGRYLVRGAQGERVSRLGGFGSGMAPLLTVSDSAAHYARQYVRSTRWAEGLGLIAGIGLAVAYQRDGGLRDGFGDPTAQVAAAGGIVALYASLPFVLRAQRSFSRAIWWHNAALPR